MTKTEIKEAIAQIDWTKGSEVKSIAIQLLDEPNFNPWGLEVYEMSDNILKQHFALLQEWCNVVNDLFKARKIQSYKDAYLEKNNGILPLNDRIKEGLDNQDKTRTNALIQEVKEKPEKVKKFAKTLTTDKERNSLFKMVIDNDLVEAIPEFLSMTKEQLRIAIPKAMRGEK